MKKLFENKKAVAAICVALVVVIAAVAAGITISKNKVKVEPETSAPTENITTTKPTTTAPTATEPTTAETTTETTTEAPSTTKAPETTRAPQTTRAPETTTKKQETTTKKQETTTKKTEYTTIPPKSAYEEECEYWGGEAAYKARIQEVANHKCPYCGKHDCPSIVYFKDSAGNIADYNDYDKDPYEYCSAVKGKTCPNCGKKLTIVIDDEHPYSKYCDGLCANQGTWN